MFSEKSFDAVYAVTHYGLEALIFLRALGLYRKPIVIWHHAEMIIPSNRIRRIFSKLFYKGIDKVCFFSQYLLDRSIKTGKIKKENAFVVHWGADIVFYDTIISQDRENKFVSTGRENRDFITLIKAFNVTSELCDIYIPSHFNYRSLLDREGIKINANIRISFVNMERLDIAKAADNAFAIVISCLDITSYPLGLTSLVEAMALGLPVITTDNPAYPIDVEKENTGLKVPYKDVNAWIKAIQYLSANPDKAKEMGKMLVCWLKRNIIWNFLQKK
ncbi:MAG: glycosyltransferase family 4 protein [Dysgonamonadaceae bacterium]|nr:glycosyltransferase family 4 protein [Dysgonamonadaceae bacterium]